MIFYFTGTGNSLYVASKVHHSTGERLVSIAECIKDDKFAFKLKRNERIGLIFPTHFWGIPWIVEYFIDHLLLTPAPGYGSTEERLMSTYTFAIVTCGTSTGSVDKMLIKKAKKLGISFDSIFPIKMIDNYVFGIDIPDEKLQGLLKKKYDAQIKHACLDIIERKESDIQIKKGLGLLFSNFNTNLRNKHCKTDGFFADSNCKKCGFCVTVCPIGCIKQKPGETPKWIYEQCTMCSACINRCPNHAIQYGSKTVDRKRYVNEILKQEIHKIEIHRNG